MVSTLEGDTAAGRAPVVLKPMGSEHPSPVLVHDYLLVMRGAERTFAAIADCWTGAPISTLLYDPAGTRHRFAAHPVRTSRLQRLGVAQDRFRGLLPLYPLAAERLAVGCHELVISSSSAFAHGVRPAAGAVHVCYCHSPFRYAWQDRDRAQEEGRTPVAAGSAEDAGRHPPVGSRGVTTGDELSRQLGDHADPDRRVLRT